MVLCLQLAKLFSTSCRSALLTRSGSALLMLFWTNVHHVVLEPQASLPHRRRSSLFDWLSDSLSLGSSNLAVFTQTAGFTLSCVRSRRRCSRVRQSQSACAELTPTSQCVSTVLTHVISFRARSLACCRVVWETQAPPSHPFARSPREEAVSCRA